MTTTDPFAVAPDPADEPETTPEPAPEPAKAAPKKPVKASSVAAEAPAQAPEGFTLSLKSDQLYDAAMTVFKFESISAGHAYLTSNAGKTEIAEILQATQNAVVFNRSISKAPTKAAGGGAGRPGKPGGAEEAPSWMGDAPECGGGHGPRKYVTKVGANGQWHAWGCSGPQGDSCEGPKGSSTSGLIFVNKPKPK